MFVVVFAYVIEVSPINMRQGGIILMEMPIYMAEKGFQNRPTLIGRIFNELIWNRYTDRYKKFAQ